MPSPAALALKETVEEVRANLPAKDSIIRILTASVATTTRSSPTADDDEFDEAVEAEGTRGRGDTADPAYSYIVFLICFRL